MWHKSGVNSRNRPRRAPIPLSEIKLRDLALRYVGKYATTRAKLRTYLARKLRERGWAEERQPDLEELTSRFAELGYVDDASYALGQSRSLTARGYGQRRLADKLRLAGVEESDGTAATAYANQEAVAAALRFAERRRLGPFANAIADPPQRQKWIAAMLRAGHSFSLSREVCNMVPGQEVNLDQLNELAPSVDQ